MCTPSLVATATGYGILSCSVWLIRALHMESYYDDSNELIAFLLSPLGFGE